MGFTTRLHRSETRESELEVTVDGESSTLSAGGIAHVAANVKHSCRSTTHAPDERLSRSLKRQRLLY